MSTPLPYNRFLTVALLWAKASAGRIRVAINEKDTTRDFDDEAQEHLKIAERRVGRDFRLYAMLEAAGPGQGLGDFATVALAVRNAEPAAFDTVLPSLLAMGEGLDEDAQRAWIEIWDDFEEADANG